MASMEGRVNDLGGAFIASSSEINHSFEVPLEKIQPDSAQARKRFDENALRDLASSLSEHGQLMPVLVRPNPEKRGHWILVAGERRWRAASQAGIKTLLAIERTSEHQVASLIENIQREDLSLLEEARGIKELIALNGWSQREAAKHLSKSVSDLNGMLAVLKLPNSFVENVLNSEHPLPRNLLIELARVQDKEKQKQFFSLALAGELTIQKIRNGLRLAAEMQEKEPHQQKPPRVGSLTKAFAKWENISPGMLEEEDRVELRRIALSILKRLGDED
ncbi:ParB/RepB/Spo0J family partition protein [Gluconobacter cerinus]|uniref:ParB/RepB/Spo0J family partition protein n=1 Tax=Gluconobacter cerinus TaxID=38307 RepID=UPI001B8BB540|nr:ParB/RepB/Spo0J family partition protein [Gluconobacter cerinus]MBS1072814.1 ParB/RepB/Spo0J family partition protein [Gluconobacter cerinus]